MLNAHVALHKAQDTLRAGNLRTPSCQHTHSHTHNSMTPACRKHHYRTLLTASVCGCPAPCCCRTLATGSAADINSVCLKVEAGPGSLVLVRKLLAAGADSAAKANKNTTPLMVATAANAPDLVSLLTAHRSAQQVLGWQQHRVHSQHMLHNPHQLHNAWQHAKRGLLAAHAVAHCLPSVAAELCCTCGRTLPSVLS